jgi:hypothetical protein
VAHRRFKFGHFSDRGTTPPERNVIAEGSAALEREIAIPSTEDTSETFQDCTGLGTVFRLANCLGEPFPAIDLKP